MATAEELTRGLVAETRRRLVDESLPRIRRCLERLDDGEIWRRPNAHTSSLGNLVLHLAGNVRQYLVSGLGGAPDVRNRAGEFSEKGPVPRPELLERLETAVAEAMKAIEGLTPEALAKVYTVQGFRETGLSILVHVVEHFSYHTGQIAYTVKGLKDVDLGFYRGRDLDARNA